MPSFTQQETIADENNRKKKLNKQNIKKLLGVYRFIVPYSKFFIAGLICLMFSSGVLLTFPYFTGKLIDVATGKKHLWITSTHQVALILMSILVVQSIFSFFRIYFFAQVIERAIVDMRKALYKKYITLPLSFHDNIRLGQLVSRITSDTSLLQDTFSVTLAEFIRQIVILVLGLSLLFITNPKLTLFMLATFPVLVIAAFIFGMYIRKLSKKTQDSLADANVVVEETLQSIHVVKAFTNEKYEINKYYKALKQTMAIGLKTAAFRSLFTSFVIFAIFGGIVIVLWYGSNLVIEESISVGELTSFVIYTMFIGGAIGSLGDIYGTIQKAIGASERIQEILAIDEEEKFLTTHTHKKKIKGNIEFEQVNFSYPTRDEAVIINEMNFAIAAGEKVALVGHSGAGKSTIVQLILRFYPINSGKIIIDGQNIHNYNLQLLRANIGIVPQEVLLFGGSIAENIAYGKPGASKQEIYSAAQKANATEFIERFPEKLDTLVGERGIKLSGGQRQRIAIARAILKDPAILILDEATSSLDAESELLVQQALNQLMQNRTTLVIAHRLITIRKVDRIFVINNGQIAESGTHQKLLENQTGIYRNLVKLQFSGDR